MKAHFLSTIALAGGLVMSAMGSTAKAQDTREPRDVVNQYFEHLQAGRFGELMELFDDQVVWHQPGKSHLSGTYTGKASLDELFSQFMALSGGTFKITAVKRSMQNGVLVAVDLSFSAARNGHSILMAGVDLMRVENGKIVEVFLFSEDQAAEDQFWDAPRDSL